MNCRRYIVLMVAIMIIVLSLFAMNVSYVNKMTGEITAQKETIKAVEEENATLKEENTILQDSLKSSQAELEEASKNIEQLLNDMLYMSKVSEELIVKNGELDEENKYLTEISEYVYNGSWDYNYTWEEVQLLAAIMFGENEGNRWEMMLTGSVVLNRVLNKNFPNNVHDVIYQKDDKYEQYAPRTKRIAEAVLAGEPISPTDADMRYLPDYYFEMAEMLLKYGPVAPPFVLYQAHFNQGQVYWEWEGEEFCYKKGDVQ